MLIAFHKPFNVLSQFTPDHPGQRTLADFGFPKDVYPIGRLDADSEGLILLSDEPQWNDRLLNPRHAHVREYWAQVERIPTPESLKKLECGVKIQDYKTLPCRAWILDPQPSEVGRVTPCAPAALTLSPREERAGRETERGEIKIQNASSPRPSPPAPPEERGRISLPQIPPRDPPIRVRKNVPDCWMALELIEGKNRQVRRMTAAIGHPTLRLIRVRIGKLLLGELPVGKWRELNQAERALL